MVHNPNLIKARDIVLVMEDGYPLCHAVALQDFDMGEVYEAFEARYTGPMWEFEIHFWNYLTKRRYLMQCAPGSFKTIYL